MSAVLPRDRAPAEASPSWRLVSEQLTWRHAAAVLLATMMMSVATWAYMFDKLGKPGVPTLMMFEVLSAFVLFGLALLAWMMAVQSTVGGSEAAMALIHGNHRQRRAGGCRELFDLLCRRPRGSVDGAHGEEKGAPARCGSFM